MYKGTITSSKSVTAGTNVPFTTVLNTNGRTAYDATTNTIQINEAGYYDIAIVLNVTGVTTDIAAQIYANGTAIPESLVQESVSATTDLATLVIMDTIKVSKSTPNNLANISVKIGGTTTSATITNGLITVENRR